MTIKQDISKSIDEIVKIIERGNNCEISIVENKIKVKEIETVKYWREKYRGYIEVIRPIIVEECREYRRSTLDFEECTSVTFDKLHENATEEVVSDFIAEYLSIKYKHVDINKFDFRFVVDDIVRYINVNGGRIKAAICIEIQEKMLKS